MAIVKSKVPEKKKVSSAMPSMADEIDNAEKVPSKPTKLALDDKGYKPAKTRVEMYNELEKEEKKIEEDVFVYANPIFRGVAFVIDMAFIYGLYLLAHQLVKPVTFLIQLFLDKYKLQIMLSQEIYLNIVLAASLFFVALFGVLVPLAFFNTSLGKRIFGLRVRGDEFYTLNLGLAFQREFIFKPISAGLVIGFIYPFFNKEKKSLHDKFAKTFVIKE